MTGTYLQMVCALIGVVGVIALMGFLLKKKHTKAGLMNVVAYQSFGPRKGIAAVKIGKEILLVGITSTDLKVLKAFDETDLETDTVKTMHDKVNKLRRLKGELNEPQ